MDNHNIQEEFQNSIHILWKQYTPSKHRFFHKLSVLKASTIKSPILLNEIYKRYQSAMHATRVMVYSIPHLDTIDFRMAKLRVIADDDGDPNGDSHHYQLRRTWTYLLGESPEMKDSDFGGIDLLVKKLDPSTAKFILKVQEIYPKSLGPWVMIEGLAHNWIGALNNSLSSHFPEISNTDYFIHNYSNEIEVKHAFESLNITCALLAQRPTLLKETLVGAKEMGDFLNILWDGLYDLILHHEKQ